MGAVSLIWHMVDTHKNKRIILAWREGALSVCLAHLTGSDGVPFAAGGQARREANFLEETDLV